MADPLRAMLRGDRAHLTDDGLRALASARWPTVAPMSDDDIARLLLLIRRSRALRRRGAHTKAVRRARARAYYRRAGEALR